MIVPQLDRQVFTPGAPRDYVSHALAIAQQFPDYGKMLQQGIRAEQERQALALKYQTDLQKAQEFLDLYPPYRDAQTAILRARAAQANAMASSTPALNAARIANLNARTAGLNPAGPGLVFPAIPKGPELSDTTGGGTQSTPAATPAATDDTGGGPDTNQITLGGTPFQSP